MKILVTGGVRSGKSRFAQERAEALASERVYLATGQAFDAEMADRIRRHQAERGPSWRTIEAPVDVEAHLSAGPVVLLDCLTLWLNNLMYTQGIEGGSEDGALLPRFDQLAAAVAASPSHVVLVTNEVGWGIVPMNPLARRFRDNAGWLAQRMATVCDEVHLCVAGLPLRVK